MKEFLAFILVSGEGTRFKSERANVLQPLVGKSIISLVSDCIFRLKPAKVYFIADSQREEFMRGELSKNVKFIALKNQAGVAQGLLAAIKKEGKGDVLVMEADLPLLRPETLKPMFVFHRKEENSLTFLSGELENPAGFNRILRSRDRIRVVEEKNSSPSVRRIKEIDAGVYLFKTMDLLKALNKLSGLKKRGKSSLAAIIQYFSTSGKKVSPYRTDRDEEFTRVHNRRGLASATEILRERKLRALADAGVIISDPRTTWVGLDVKIGKETVLYSSVIIEGKSVIGKECRLYPFSHIIDSRLGNRVSVLSSTMIEESVVEDDARVGPFAHLRPRTVIRAGAKVGNFVEMKNTVFGKRSKAGHLSYLGDCEVEEEVNIGAGTITCNYDGRKKHKTRIEAGAFIGSGTELVAPLKIGRRAYIGAGSTITKNVKPESLAVSRSRQVEKPGWARRMRKK